MSPDDDDNPTPPRPMPDGDDPIPVMLHPIDTSVGGEATVVSFGAPFPRGVLLDASSVVVTDASGTELVSHVEPLVLWRLTGEQREGDGSIRSLLVQVEMNFESETPVEIRLVRNAERTLELASPPAATDGWVEVTLDDFPEALAEPPVYATFSADWLSLCGLRSYSNPTGELDAWEWYDAFFVGAAATAANDLPAGQARIDVVANEPWLFDRTMTFFTVYARTGDVRWLRHAHRSARFYLSHLVDGYFDLAPNGSDLKYSYGQSLLVDMMLTGDSGMLAPIEDIAAAGEGWRETYTTNSGFWTERHQTYALLAALSAFEATGATRHETRLLEVVDASIDMAENPANPSWEVAGCMLHTFAAHEGVDDSRPACSPWMSALFADAMWRYYLHSEDARALHFLGNLGEFVTTLGIRTVGDHVEPWYLASSEVEFSEGADQEHACDVAGIVVRAIYARSLLDEPYDGMTAGRDDLLASCQANLDSWHRPGSATLAEWRLAPPRKFSWWFGSTHDMAWMSAQMD